MDWTKLGGAPPPGLAQRINQVFREIGARSKFYGRNEAGEATKGLNHLLWEAPARALALPVKGIGGIFGGLLHGPKLISGPMAGKRLRAVKGPGEFSHVTPEVWDAWKRGDIKMDGVKVPAGWGRNHYFKRNYERGGLVGAVKKHPYKAGGITLAAALLATQPGLRPLATGLLPEVPENGVSPAIQQEFSKEVSGQSPLTRRAWG